MYVIVHRPSLYFKLICLELSGMIRLFRRQLTGTLIKELSHRAETASPRGSIHFDSQGVPPAVFVGVFHSCLCPEDTEYSVIQLGRVQLRLTLDEFARCVDPGIAQGGVPPPPWVLAAGRLGRHVSICEPSRKIFLTYTVGHTPHLTLNHDDCPRCQFYGPPEGILDISIYSPCCRYASGVRLHNHAIISNLHFSFIPAVGRRITANIY